MDHASQIRIIPGAKNAVLFLHGIVGTPRHFSHILPLVDAVPDDWSYYNLLLPGHGGSVQDFSRSTMTQWKQEVWRVFLQLAEQHEQVAVVGHSMGTLFALQLSMDFPEKIPFLFLIACPIRPWVGLQGFNCCVRASFGITREDHPAEMAITKAGGTTLTKKLWKYIPWIPNMIALLAEANKTEKMLSNLQTKAVVFQSRRDEMVSSRSGKILAKYSVVDLTTLEGATHFYYPDPDQARVCAAFTEMCEVTSGSYAKPKEKERES